MMSSTISKVGQDLLKKISIQNAIQFCQADKVRKLIQTEEDVETQIFTTKPIFIASIAGSVPIVRHLLQIKPSIINDADFTGHTPLMLAVYHKHTTLIRYLLHQKSLNILATKPSGQNILDIALLRKNFEALKIIKEEVKDFQRVEALWYCKFKQYPRAFVYKLMKHYF